MKMPGLTAGTDPVGRAGVSIADMETPRRKGPEC